MTSEYDHLRDLAELVAAGLNWSGMAAGPAAARIAGRLGIGEDDRAEDIEQVLAEALGPRYASPDAETVKSLIAAAVCHPERWLEPGRTYEGEYAALAVLAALTGHDLAIVALAGSENAATAEGSG